MQHTVARKARKVHDCADCRREIRIGEIYLRHVAAPDDGDLGNEGWWHIVECRDCAARGTNNRVALIEARAGA